MVVETDVGLAAAVAAAASFATWETCCEFCAAAEDEDDTVDGALAGVVERDAG